MTSPSSLTPLADELEPTIQRLEAQLPATRAALGEMTDPRRDWRCDDGKAGDA